MKEWDQENLLKIPQVVEEIKRHQWIESQKANRDVGFDWATTDWIKKFSKAWVAYHKPSAKSVSQNSLDVPKRKRRSAKSYFF